MTIIDSSLSVDHSIQLSDDLGEIFDSGFGCDYLISFKSPNGNTLENGAPETTEMTICVHKLILKQLPFFSLSVGVNTTTVTLRKPCKPHLVSFVRYDGSNVEYFCSKSCMDLTNI